MRVTIKDRNILGSVRPAELLSYIRAAQWRQTEELPRRALCFDKSTDGGNYEVTVPLAMDVGDYSFRVSEVLETLEAAEARSQEDILRDVLTSSSDLIRIRSSALSASDGSISIDAGVALFAQARELVLAAASATVSPRAYWPRRRPPQAVEYLEKVRLGQTERGSFVLTIQSPLPPILRAPDELFEEIPFPRRVMQMLLQSLQAVKEAARAAMTSEDLSPFQHAIESGVSANLCDALVALAATDPDDGFDLSLSFAAARPVANGPMHVVTRFAPDIMPVLSEAARLFKEIEPDEEFTAFGFVERLDRVVGATQGEVIIKALVEGTLRRIKVELPESTYQQAVQAHAASTAVYCEGELVKRGRTYQLQNVRRFVVLTAQDYDLSGPNT